MWHPLRNHPLDHLNETLYGYGETPYVVTQNMRCKFVITSNGEQVLVTDDVISVCYFLNVHSAHTMRNAPKTGSRLA